MTARRIAILTGSEPRHNFLQLAISIEGRFETVVSICEGRELSLASRSSALADPDGVIARHVEQWQKTEQDFFASFIRYCPDRSRPTHIPKGAINDRAVVDQVVAAKPEIIVCFGTSILTKDWIDAFPGRILNLHLGLSPYYRGSGTNFWALANSQPELVGATFMILEAGVDSGPVLHQIRAKILPGDNAHQIGARAVADAVPVYCDLISVFDGPVAQTQFAKEPRIFCRRADFNATAVQRLNSLLTEGLIENYLAHEAERNARFPIMRHPKL